MSRHRRDPSAERKPGTILSAFFENDAIVWTGSVILLGELLIIAQHKYCSSTTLVLIWLCNWFMAVLHY